MNVVTLRINGTDVSAREGETLLDVARDNDVRIPTLCHIDGLTDVGACRLCLVEVKGSTKLSPACVTKVAEGMEIETETAQLRAYRRQIVELLFAERNHVCSVCVANGNCELQWVAYSVGMDHVRYPYQHPHTTMDATHPRFVVDHARCILCTRCVRVCDEIEGPHVWDVAGRGTDARVITELNVPWGQADSCTSCGKCIQVCPTGSLFEKSQAALGIRKNRDFLTYIRNAREKKEWIR